jgi:hypothetical protein
VAAAKIADDTRIAHHHSRIVSGVENGLRAGEVDADAHGVELRSTSYSRANVAEANREHWRLFDGPTLTYSTKQLTCTVY